MRLFDHSGSTVLKQSAGDVKVGGTAQILGSGVHGIQRKARIPMDCILHHIACMIIHGCGVVVFRHASLWSSRLWALVWSEAFVSTVGGAVGEVARVSGIQLSGQKSFNHNLR